MPDPNTDPIPVPGNGGRNCPGNGNTEGVECCCDECDYLICCAEDFPSTP